MSSSVFDMLLTSSLPVTELCARTEFMDKGLKDSTMEAEGPCSYGYLAISPKARGISVISERINKYQTFKRCKLWTGMGWNMLEWAGIG